MKRFRLAVASVRTLPLDFEAHVERLHQVFIESCRYGVQVLALPELVLSGYECGDFFWHPWVSERAWEALQSLLPLTEGLITAIGLPLRIGDSLYNAAAVIADKRLLGFALKTRLAKEGVFYEPRWFTPGPVHQQLVEPRSGCPAGAFVIEWEGLRIGIEICEEAWHAPRLLDRLRPHIVLSLNASPFEIGKPERRRRLVTETSYRYQCAYLYANLLGNEAGRLLYDGESLIAYKGELLASTPPFSYRAYELATAEIDPTPLHTGRGKVGGTYPDPLEKVALSTPPKVPYAKPRHTAILPPLAPEEAITQAIAMGLWDYLVKTRHRGFVISLSGGLDSAACAVFAALAIQNAQKALPPKEWEATVQTLGQVPRVYTFYQATAQSSAQTYERARALAEAIEASFFRWEVQPIVDAYEALFSQWLGRPLSWDQDDLARQNLQARVRVPSIWLAANVLGALLLSTGNRSELSVGYTTMDGDTAGGLAPIAGLSKTFLREWALWAASHFGWPILAEIAQATPTAELRPGLQTDETDLMPYPLLNFFEERLMHEGQAPSQLAELAQPHFAHLSVAELRSYARRYKQRFGASQWKRERAAPGFHLDKYNLDPRSAARFPILSAFSKY